MAKDGFRIMDSDLHVMEPPDLYDRYLDPRFQAVAPGSGNDLGMEALGIGDSREQASQEKMLHAQRALSARVQDHYLEENFQGYTPELALKAMDREGVDVAVLFRSKSHMHVDIDDLPPDYALAICKAFNDWLAEFTLVDRSRLKGAAILSLHDPGLAAQEARRAIQDLGMVAVTLLPHPVAGRYLHDPECDVLWAELQDLGIPVTFHSQSGGYARISPGNWLRKHTGSEVLSHTFTAPLNVMWAIGAVILGGVLERFPRLRMAFLEGNCSWLPWLLWRLDEQWELFGEVEDIKLTLKPNEYFQRQCYISVDPGEALVEQVVQLLGDDNLVISTDYPHLDSLYPYAMDTFLEQQGISRETKRKILWDNCARLYQL